MNPVIAVVAGGYSGEYSVSLRSAAGIISWINRALFTPYIYVIERERWYVRLDDVENYPLIRGPLVLI